MPKMITELSYLNMCFNLFGPYIFLYLFKVSKSDFPNSNYTHQINT